MKKRFLFVLGLLFSVAMFSQNEKSDYMDYSSKKNLIKTNVTSLAFRNFEFQYERIINKTISVNLNYGFIPKGSTPMQSVFENYIDDQEASDLLNELTFKQSNIILEARVYLGKGYGKGFYLAPYYNYAKYSFGDVMFEYTDDSAQQQNFKTDASISANTVGLLIGTQFNLGKNLVLDWWILGAQYGGAQGTLTGVSSKDLTANEQAALKSELDDLSVPFVTLENTVNAKGVDSKIEGPFAGLRAGLSIGYRF